MAGCASLCREEFRLKNFLLDHDRPGIFVQFQCGHLHLYIAWRVFWALYHVAWIIYTGVAADEWAPDPSQEVKWFIFLTNWAFFTLTVATIVDAIVVVYIRQKRRDIIKVHSEMTWYLKANWVIFNLCNAVSVTMTIAFWALVYYPGYPNTSSALNISTHVINAVYVIVNVSVTGMPIRILHFWHPVIYGTVYSLFSLFYHLGDGTNHNGNPYIYKPINWNNAGSAVGYCVLVTFVAIPVVHFILFSIHFMKIYLSRCFRLCGRGIGASMDWDENEMEREGTFTSKSTNKSSDSEPQLYT